MSERAKKMLFEKPKKSEKPNKNQRLFSIPKPIPIPTDVKKSSPKGSKNEQRKKERKRNK
jgi:hypothetical protein